jgi:hypothetical protein
MVLVKYPTPGRRGRGAGSADGRKAPQWDRSRLVREGFCGDRLAAPAGMATYTSFRGVFWRSKCFGLDAPSSFVFQLVLMGLIHYAFVVDYKRSEGLMDEALLALLRLFVIQSH